MSVGQNFWIPFREFYRKNTRPLLYVFVFHLLNQLQYDSSKEILGGAGEKPCKLELDTLTISDCCHFCFHCAVCCFTAYFWWLKMWEFRGKTQCDDVILYVSKIKIQEGNRNYPYLEHFVLSFPSSMGP